jgi:hypothetical protein
MAGISAIPLKKTVLGLSPGEKVSCNLKTKQKEGKKTGAKSQLFVLACRLQEKMSQPQKKCPGLQSQ